MSVYPLGRADFKSEARARIQRRFLEARPTEQPVERRPVRAAQPQRQQRLRDRVPGKCKQLPKHQRHRSLAQDQEALHRLFHHLVPGGALFLDYHVPYKDANEWRYWVKEERDKLPEPWPSGGQRKIAGNGEEIELQVRLVALDPLEQVAIPQSRVILWREGQVVQQEEHTLLERLYFKNELVAMLAAAGFREVEVCDGYTGDCASPGSEILVYIARKESTTRAVAYPGGRLASAWNRPGYHERWRRWLSPLRRFILAVAGQSRPAAHPPPHHATKTPTAKTVDRPQENRFDTHGAAGIMKPGNPFG